MSHEMTTTEDADFSVSKPAPSIVSGKPASTPNLAMLLAKRPELTKALIKAQKSCQAVPHDARNQHHNYAYTSSEAIIEEAKNALGEADLAIIPVEQSVDGHERSGADRFELVRVFLLCHSSGESIPITVRWPIVPDKGRPLDKATAAADTLSLAYWLRDLLLMPRVDEKDEVSGRDDRPKQNQTPAKPRARVINADELKQLEDALRKSKQTWENLRSHMKLPQDAAMAAMTEPWFKRALEILQHAPPAPTPAPVERQAGDPDPEEIIDEPTRKHLGILFTGSGWKWADLLAKIGAAPGAKPADLTYRQYEAAVAILSPAKVG